MKTGLNIITWNCNGGFRNKLDPINKLEADILVIQECEDPARSTEAYKAWAGSQYLWKGESKNKGIGVFARNENTIQELDWQGSFTIQGLTSKSPTLTWHSNHLRLFMPVLINNEHTLLSVWTKGGRDDVFGYMGQFWKYLQIHRKELSNRKTIIAGDFNSNVKWDKPDRWWNHSDVIKELADLKVMSLYHKIYNEEQGRETQPTFYLHRNESKPYHIDYIFVSEDLLSRSKLEFPNEEWLKFSDHRPMCMRLAAN
ncbi:endonuclease/exonuclease/phosphatase family protein [Marinomonas epiphytica]